MPSSESHQNRLYNCVSGSFFAGLDVMLTPSAFTSYVSGSTVISGVLSLNTMSFFPMFRQFSTGTTVFYRPYFSLIFSSMAALDTKVRQDAYFAFPCAANIGW